MLKLSSLFHKLISHELNRTKNNVKNTPFRMDIIGLHLGHNLIKIITTETVVVVDINVIVIQISCYFMSLFSFFQYHHTLTSEKDDREVARSRPCRCPPGDFLRFGEGPSPRGRHYLQGGSSRFNVHHHAPSSMFCFHVIVIVVPWL